MLSCIDIEVEAVDLSSKHTQKGLRKTTTLFNADVFVPPTDKRLRYIDNENDEEAAGEKRFAGFTWRLLCMVIVVDLS